MNLFLEMLKRNRSSPDFDRAIRFSRPLNDHFGVNHFWYYRISCNGEYSYMGTNEDWNEYCFEHSLINFFPCLRHPEVLSKGISFMQASPSDINYQQVKKAAWDRFRINFNLNLYTLFSGGIEAFGFGSKFNDYQVEERLINELPLLRCFIKSFKENHKNLFYTLQDNCVDLASHMGTQFYESPQKIKIPFGRESFLNHIGHKPSLKLTAREKDLVKFLANGYPASYIRKKLHLSIRTVENYIAALKDKLNCSSKTELIEKSQSILAIGLCN